MAKTDIAEIIAGRGVTLDLDEGDVVTEVVVLCRVEQREGETTLGVAVAEGTSWIDQVGLVRAADSLLANNWERTGD